MGQKQSTTRFPEESPATLQELHGSHSRRFAEPPAGACCAPPTHGDHEVIGADGDCTYSKFLKEDYDEGKVFDHENFGYDFGYHLVLQTQGMIHRASQIVVVENAIDMREAINSTAKSMVVFHYTSLELAKGIMHGALTSEPEVVAALQATAKQAGLGKRIVACEKSPAQLGSKLAVLDTLYASGDSNPEENPSTQVLADCCIPILIGAHRILDFSKESVKEIIPITQQVESAAPLSARSNSSEKIFENMQARVDVLSNTLGPTNVEAMLASGVLASSLRSAGHHAEAAMLYRDLLQKSAEHFGLEHEYTLIAMGNLAATTRLMGNYAAAESLGRQRLELSDRSLGKRHQGTMAALRGLILTLCEQGKWAEAEKFKNIEDSLASGQEVPILAIRDQ